MTLNGLGNFFSVVEIRTKLVSVSTLLLASLYTVWRKGFPDPVMFALMWAAALTVDMGTTAFNNYYDYWRGTDRYRNVSEKDKVLITSGVSPGFAFAVAFWCFALAVVLGLFISIPHNMWVIPYGAACMAVGYFYTGGPFPISRTPFGELFAGLCLGYMLFTIACRVWSVPPDSSLFMAALPSSLWIASILMVNNTCDIEGDRASGRKTFSILVGPVWGEIAGVLLTLTGQASAMTAAFLGVLPVYVFYTAPAFYFPIVLIFVSMHRLGYSHKTKGLQMQNILKCFLLFTLSIVSGFVFEFFFK